MRGKSNFQVTKEVYTAFQQCSGDYNPLHNDEELAKRKGFPERVMYGNILNAFASALVASICQLKISSSFAGHTIQAPVFMGDKLEAEVKVDGIYESVNASASSSRSRMPRD